jgi:hypothetical protein
MDAHPITTPPPLRLLERPARRAMPTVPPLAPLAWWRRWLRAAR